MDLLPIIERLTQRGFPTVVIGHRANGLPWVDSAHDLACREPAIDRFGLGKRRRIRSRAEGVQRVVPGIHARERGVHGFHGRDLLDEHAAC